MEGEYTRQGGHLICKKYLDYNGYMTLIVKRLDKKVEDHPYAILNAYDWKTGIWGQGNYDYKTLEGAEKALKESLDKGTLAPFDPNNKDHIFRRELCYYLYNEGPSQYLEDTMSVGMAIDVVDMVKAYYGVELVVYEALELVRSYSFVQRMESTKYYKQAHEMWENDYFRLVKMRRV